MRWSLLERWEGLLTHAAAGPTAGGVAAAVYFRPSLRAAGAESSRTWHWNDEPASTDAVLDFQENLLFPPVMSLKFPGLPQVGQRVL